MANVKINKDKCKGCFLCISFCPKGAIKKSKSLNKRGFNYVEFYSDSDCLGCGICAIVCPDCCIDVDK